MVFDYSKLRGRIVEKCRNQAEFARRMSWSERTLSLKLNGKVFWRQPEICRAVDVLELTDRDILTYFFTKKVQNI